MSGASLRHWDEQTRALRSLSVGQSESDIVPSERAWLAVDQTDSIGWLAQNDDLVKVDLQSGSETRYPVPIGSDNSAEESHRPPELQGLHGVDAVAVSADGSEVAVALTAVSAIEKFAVATSTFSEVPLSTDHDASGLAFLKDGRLVAAQLDYGSSGGDSVQVFNGDGTSAGTLDVPDARQALTMPDGAIVVGTNVTNLVGSDLTTTPLNSTSNFGVTPGITLPNGDRVVAGRNSLTVSPANGGPPEASVSWPSEVCSGYVAPPSLDSSDTETTGAAGHECSRQPLAMVADGVGNVWLEFQLSRGLTLAEVTNL